VSNVSLEFKGRRYIITIGDDGMRGYVFTISKVGKPYYSVIIDGLTKEEVDKLVRILRNMEPKCIDCWVEFVFFSEDLNGKHAQEHFEKRLEWVIKS